jgi:hypothetical protein
MIQNLLQHHRIFALSCLIGIIVAFCVNYRSLSYGKIDEYELGKWQGKIEESEKAGRDRDDAIFVQMKAIREKIDGICDNITDIKVQAAKNALMYGGGSGSAVYVVFALVSLLVKKKDARNSKPQ